MLKNKLAAVLVLALVFSVRLSAQSDPSEPQNPPKGQVSQDLPPQQDSGTSVSPSPTPTPAPAGTMGTVSVQPSTTNKQPSRILGIIPNFRAVSADTQLPPLSPSGKFWLATKSSFDYSAFLWSAMLGGFGSINGTDDNIWGSGATGYGRRYWHWMANGAISNYTTQAILPTYTLEDPRYYTLGHGGIFRRTGYAISRLVVTKTDSGNWGPNFSNIPGNGIAAGLSNLYYPAQERNWVRTYQNWAVQVGGDGLSNILKEFWPDISNMLPGGKKNKSNNNCCPATH
jgi:hypothetical protein